MGDQSTPLPPLSLFSTLRWDVVRRHVERLRPESILEFGCGAGGFGARFSRLAAYTGVEPDATSHAIAAERVRGCGGNVVHGDHRALPDGAEYDLVCAFEVLEHIEDDKGTLAAWMAFVRPGGHLMLSMPAWPERYGPLDERAGHLRRYEPEVVRELLIGAGLEGPRIELIGWPVGYALEAMRNRLAARKREQFGGLTMQQRTASSARFFHLGGPVGSAATRALAFPFRHLQRLRPTAGTCLVAIARQPG